MNGRLTPWLIGVLCATALSLLSYIWVDREGRISDLERRVEIREVAWYQARYLLHDRITTLEHEVANLKTALGIAPRPPGGKTP